MESKKFHITLKSGLKCTGTLTKIDKVNNVIILSNGLKDISDTNPGVAYETIELARKDIASCIQVTIDPSPSESKQSEPSAASSGINAIPESKVPVKQEQENIGKSYDKSESFFDKLDGMTNPEVKQESKKYNDKNIETFNIAASEAKEEEERKIEGNRGSRGLGNRGRGNSRGGRGNRGSRSRGRGGYYMNMQPMTAYNNPSAMNMRQGNGMYMGINNMQNWQGQGQRQGYNNNNMFRGGYYNSNNNGFRGRGRGRGNGNGRGGYYQNTFPHQQFAYQQQFQQYQQQYQNPYANVNMMGKGKEIGLGGEIHPDKQINVPSTQINNIPNNPITMPMPNFSNNNNKFNHHHQYPSSNYNNRRGRPNPQHQHHNPHPHPKAQPMNNPNLKQIGFNSTTSSSSIPSEPFIPSSLPFSLLQQLPPKTQAKPHFDSDMYDLK